MSKKTNKIILINGRYEHDIKINKKSDKRSLRCSKSDSWSDHMKGEELVEVKDTGDSVIVNGEEMGYDSAFYLYLALKEYHESDPYAGKIEIIGRDV